MINYRFSFSFCPKLFTEFAKMFIFWSFVTFHTAINIFFNKVKNIFSFEIIITAYSRFFTVPFGVYYTLSTPQQVPFNFARFSVFTCSFFNIQDKSVFGFFFKCVNVIFHLVDKQNAEVNKSQIKTEIILYAN